MGRKGSTKYIYQPRSSTCKAKRYSDAQKGGASNLVIPAWCTTEKHKTNSYLDQLEAPLSLSWGVGLSRTERSFAFLLSFLIVCSVVFPGTPSREEAGYWAAGGMGYNSLVFLLLRVQPKKQTSELYSRASAPAHRCCSPLLFKRLKVDSVSPDARYFRIPPDL